MELDTGQWIVIIICAVLIIAYIRGYIYNHQQAGKIAPWLIDGLKEWGKVTPGEKMPGMVTGGRLIVEQASKPFRKIEALYLLAPRENPLFWIFHLLQGRGDELIVWINLQHTPNQNVEVARKGDRQFAGRLKAKDKPPLTEVEAQPGFQIALDANDGSSLPEWVGKFIERYRNAIVHLSLRGNKPNLFLRLKLHKVMARPLRELFNELSELEL